MNIGKPVHPSIVEYLGKSVHPSIVEYSTILDDNIRKPLFDIIYNSINESTLHQIMNIQYNLVIRNIIHRRTLLL